jgi:hypothetical protein
LLIGDVHRGQGCSLSLEEQARLRQLERGYCKTWLLALPRQAAYIGTRADSDFDKSLYFQRNQRFPYCRTTGAILDRKLPLCRKSVADREFSEFI